jgi:hypothetical protein
VLLFQRFDLRLLARHLLLQFLEHRQRFHARRRARRRKRTTLRRSGESRPRDTQRGKKKEEKSQKKIIFLVDLLTLCAMCVVV